MSYIIECDKCGTVFNDEKDSFRSGVAYVCSLGKNPPQVKKQKLYLLLGFAAKCGDDSIHICKKCLKQYVDKWFD